MTDLLITVTHVHNPGQGCYTFHETGMVFHQAVNNEETVSRYAIDEALLDKCMMTKRVCSVKLKTSWGTVRNKSSIVRARFYAGNMEVFLQWRLLNEFNNDMMRVLC